MELPSLQSWTMLWLVILVFVISRLVAFRSGVKTLDNLPGMRSLCAPLSYLGALLPTSRFNPGMHWPWQWRGKVYSKYGAETISVVPYLIGRPYLYTSSIEVARQVLSTKGQFEKTADMTDLLLLWGNNIFTEGGDEWRRHRRILGPAFSSETHKLVWEETISTYRQMTEAESWDLTTDVTLPAVNDITTKLTLIILTRCAFGLPLSWRTPDSPDGGMPYLEAFKIVASAPVERLVTPRWMYKLPIKKLKNLETAYITLATFMKKLITTRKLEIRAENTSGEYHERRDIFSRMIKASEAEGKLALTDDELTGNTFFMLFAGHETSAHILDATIGFLALYEDIQEEVYRQITEITSGNTPHFTDFSKFFKLRACFLEAGRLFPPVPLMARDSKEYVSLPVYGEGGVKRHVSLRPGISVVVDLVALHYNPRHFPEPEEFRPSRWYDVSDEELPVFSLGPRVCPGKRFAFAEAVCFLALLLQEWKLDIILREGETRSQWRNRVMRGHQGMIFGVENVPVRLLRRGDGV